MIIAAKQAANKKELAASFVPIRLLDQESHRIQKSAYKS